MAGLGQDEARAVVDAALAHARKIEVPVSVAIMDSGRELLAFARMDGALLVSIETALGKAYAARSLNKATGDVGGDTLPGHPLYGLEIAARQPFVTFGGGDVLRAGGEIIGAVGVAGGTIDQDEEILAHALAAMAEMAAA
jgi:uncharacterized protein GlcG (DUF336 family)